MEEFAGNHYGNGSIGNGRLVEPASSEGSCYTKMFCHPWKYATLKKLFAGTVCIPILTSYWLNLPFYFSPILIVFLFLPILIIYVGVNNFIYVLFERRRQRSQIDKYIEFSDDCIRDKYSGTFLPIRDLYELYVDGKINFKDDLLHCLEHRNEYVSYKLQWWHLKFFIMKFIPEMLHGKKQDAEQVCDHYDRGNDFYECFLGPTMIYTSGIRKTESDSLEDMQLNKIKDVFRKIMLKEGDRHLDIGCGWGTLSNAAAQDYGALSTGVSIAKRQIEFAEQKSSDNSKGAKFLCMDYREIPMSKYDKITCLEMAEHVGIILFPNFLKQVYNMLDEKGIFYLQIAGLRRAWQWEDMMWGFFMDTYVFPGADASLPLIFPVGQLEAAGFEVQSVETIGIHYSETIRCWYNNWIKPENKEKMVMNYGSRLYKVWEVFLAWSTIIARQGNSTCYQIVAHKNTNSFPRKQFIYNKI